MSTWKDIGEQFKDTVGNIGDWGKNQAGNASRFGKAGAGAAGAAGGAANWGMKTVTSTMLGAINLGTKVIDNPIGRTAVSLAVVVAAYKGIKAAWHRMTGRKEQEAMLASPEGMSMQEELAMRRQRIAENSALLGQYTNVSGTAVNDYANGRGAPITQGAGK